MTIKRGKIILTYQDGENYNTEQVWAEQVGDYYKIKNIPFFASNIALDDIIKVEDDEGALHFDKLVTPSGNSVVQITFFKIESFEEVTKELEKLGCGWEESHLASLISVNIPKDVGYKNVKDFLESKVMKKVLDYKEACLGFK
jgi:hypothetical protein